MSSRFSDEEAGGILARSGFRKPLRVAQSLRVMRGLSGCRRESPEFAENLFREALRAADPDAVILHLATLIESASSPGALLDLLSQKPQALRTLCGVLGASTYLSQLLLRSPGYVDWLLEEDRLTSIPGRADYLAQARAAGPLESPETALDTLRRHRRRETLRIAAQDILGFCTPDQTARQVSHLADAVLQRTFDLLAPAGLESKSDTSDIWILPPSRRFGGSSAGRSARRNREGARPGTSSWAAVEYGKSSSSPKPSSFSTAGRSRNSGLPTHWTPWTVCWTADSSPPATIGRFATVTCTHREPPFPKNPPDGVGDQ